MPRTAAKVSSSELYEQFLEYRNSFSSRAWTLAIFEGSPAGSLYSWCPDCVVASAHVRNFEKYFVGQGRNLRLLKFKVGSRREWESKSKLNPFKAKFPFLSDVPTAILFMGKLDVFRVVAPQESDLRAMCERIPLYEEQIRLKQWRPPVKRT